MNLHRRIFLLLALLPALFFLLPRVSAQDNAIEAEAPPSTRLAIGYMCGPHDSVTLTGTLSVKYPDRLRFLENALLEFYATGETEVALGTAKTDQDGIAKVSFNHLGIPRDKEGKITYQVRFAGTSRYEEGDDSFTAMPATLKLLFSIEDSVKTLTINATYTDAGGKIQPLANETLPIYIPRLFSLLPIGEISLDENGTGTMEFPTNIVGDTLGNLIVIARLEEHDDFGTVQGKNKINWGVPRHYYTAEVPSRELWTPIAPLWMIISLIIMLLGVWGHYIYAAYELWMIKMLGNREKNRFS